MTSRFSAAAAAAKSLQSCPTLWDPIDGSPPGSTIPGILQARILEWVAISFSKAWKWKLKVKSHSRVGLFMTPWTEAYQAPLSMRFSRQEYWSGVPLPAVLIKIQQKKCFWHKYKNSYGISRTPNFCEDNLEKEKVVGLIIPDSTSLHKTMVVTEPVLE